MSLPSVALSSGMVKQFHHSMRVKSFLPLRIKMSLTWGTLHNTTAENPAGLSEVLTGLTSVKECLYQTQYEDLSIMFAGKYPPNPVELLSGQYFEDLLKAAKESYDYVLIDVPPLGSVIDAAVVAAKCDGTILVISDNQVRYRQAIEVIEQLRKSGSKILGVVRNNIKKKDGGYYKKYYKNRYQ